MTIFLLPKWHLPGLLCCTIQCVCVCVYIYIYMYYFDRWPLELEYGVTLGVS